MQVTPETMTLGAGQKQALFATAFDQRGNLITSAKFTFWSSDTLIAQVSLIFRDHPTRKREMEGARRADHSVKPSTIRLHIHEKAERAIDRDRQNAVKWKKIWRQRDPEVGLVGNHMAAVAAHTKPAHAPTHQPNPQRVGQFVSEDVN